MSWRNGVRVAYVGFALLLASALLGPRADAYIYWGNGATNTIGRANLDGSGANQRFIAVAAAGVAVDRAHIYWAETGVAGTAAIGRANLDGSDVNRSFIVVAAPGTNPASLAGVAVDGTHIYWANNQANANTIGRANLDGSGVNQGFIAGAADPRGVAVNGRHIFWANRGTNAIGRASLDGSGVDQGFVDSTILRDPRGVALDRRHIYWANGPGKIARANLDGSGLNQSFIGAISSPIGVAVNRAHIYWGAQGIGGVGGKIGRDDLQGSDAEMSFISGVSPGWVAVDALPSNAFSFGRKQALADGSVRIGLNIPGPGVLSGQDAVAKTKRRTVLVKRVSTRAGSAGAATLTLRPSAAAKRLLRRGRTVSARVKVTFRPSGGIAASKTTAIRLHKKIQEKKHKKKHKE